MFWSLGIEIFHKIHLGRRANGCKYSKFLYKFIKTLKRVSSSFSIPGDVKFPKDLVTCYTRHDEFIYSKPRLKHSDRTEEWCELTDLSVFVLARQWHPLYCVLLRWLTGETWSSISCLVTNINTHKDTHTYCVECGDCEASCLHHPVLVCWCWVVWAPEHGALLQCAARAVLVGIKMAAGQLSLGRTGLSDSGTLWVFPVWYNRWPQWRDSFHSANVCEALANWCLDSQHVIYTFMCSQQIFWPSLV